MNQKLFDGLYRRLSTGSYAPDVDLHVHSNFSDGESTAEEIILSAIDKGLKILGFSDHSVIEGEDWTMTRDSESRYYGSIMELKEKYKGRIDIYCGIEQDYISRPAAPYYDYIIGSVHGVPKGDSIAWADVSAESMKAAIEEFYNGDYYAYAEEYFEEEADIYNRTGCDIAGHFDILTKFNGDGIMFDPHHPRYVRAWKNAIDRLCERRMIFEINMGCVINGYRKAPYPDEDIISYIREKGGILKINSDSHHAATLAYDFNRYK